MPSAPHSFHQTPPSNHLIVGWRLFSMIRWARSIFLIAMMASVAVLCGGGHRMRALAGDDPAEGPRKIGPLVLIGGHEDDDGGETILREVVRLAGGEEARIAVITIASEKAEEM